MCRIVFTVARQIIAQAVMPVFLPLCHLLPEVMAVSAAAMHDFPEQPPSDHIQRHQLPLAVAAVFKQHAVCSRLLIGVHKLIAVRDRIRPAYL